MLQRLAEHWWVVLVRGIIAVLFGILALVWPGITLLALITLYGAFALVDGVFAVFSAISRGRQHERWGLLLFQGLVGIGAGIVAFAWPGITAVVLLVVIAVWAVWKGILEIMAGIRIRKEVTGEWVLYATGAASVLFGILLMISPGRGAVALVWLVGIYAIVAGILLAFLSFRLRGMRGEIPPGGARPAL